tara:strand:+ start:123 stop:665 length:543 start_codon:yes stop_codon:yes gene_type:complete
VNKSQIRKRILKIRKKNSYKNLKINFEDIMKILKKEKINNQPIGGYYPYNFEVDSIEILKKLEKKNFQISLPIVKKNFKMDFFSWTTKDPLLINEYGIPEPISNRILFPTILLVPLVAFDKNLNRIGYGGGFYDRYIERMKQIKKMITIGLAFSYQKIDNIPTNRHDIKLDYIVTDKKIK